MTPTTILYLDHTARWSGGEIALQRFLAEIDRTQFHPIVVLAEDGPLATRLIERGVETHVIPLSQHVREIRKDTLGLTGLAKQVGGSASAFLAYARTLARLIRERNVALIHCNSLKSDLYGAFAGRLSHVPVLWHVRDHIDPSYLPKATVAIFRTLARTLPTFVIANSESTQERLFPADSERYRDQRSRVIYGGLAPEELDFPPPEPLTNGWPSRPLKIGIVGRLAHWKGQHIFLEAAKRLASESDLPEVRFVLVGSALFGEEEYETKLKQQAESLGEKVEFLGFRGDVAEVLRGLDIFVHASVTPEPFGQVVLEGMAAGLPVVASDGGGVREIVRNGEDGLLFPMGDADALTAQLKRLLTDPSFASRLAQNGYAAARERFTATKTARNIETLYREILTSRARRSGRQGGADADSLSR